MSESPQLPAPASYLRPVSASAPAGRDARLDPEHELLRSEIAKLSAVQGERPDWPMIQSLGTEILLARSKDLLIAVYVACAVTARAGLPGAAHGVMLVAGMLSSFGAALFPARTRARANAIEWLLEWLSAYLDSAPTDSPSDVNALRTLLRELRDAAVSALGQDAPQFELVLRSCERLERSASASAKTDVVAHVAPPAPPGASPEGGHASSASSLSFARLPEDALRSASESRPTSFEGWLLPLPGTASGVDASYDELYVAARVEIEKLGGLSSATPDWKSVLEHSDCLLRSTSKDLTLATYLTAALLERRGLVGLTDGLRLCTGLLQRYWESMFPPVARLKRRANGLEWLFERVTARLSEDPVQDAASLDALAAALEELQTIVTVRFDGVLPSLSALAEVVVRLRSAPAAAATGSATSVLPASATTQVSGTDTALVTAVVSPVARAPQVADDSARYVFAAPPASAPEQNVYVARAGSLLVELALSRLAADQLDSRSYRWLRAGLWLRWERAPAANRRGRIDSDGPSPTRRAELFKAAQAAQAAQWSELLTLSEQLLAQHPLWLDPNRLSALALQNLGPDYALALQHVESESRALFARLPELATLQFSDGTPLATPETLRWLRPKSGPTNESGPSVELSAPLVERLQRAERAALSELEALLKVCGSRRNSYLLRLELAGALARGGHVLQAVHVYLGLERDIDAHDLEQWEPELALLVLQPLWSLLSKGSPLGVGQTEATRICARLARLSPTTLV